MQRQPNCSLRSDGRTGMTKLIVAFRNFANAPKKVSTVPSRSEGNMRYAHLSLCLVGYHLSENRPRYCDAFAGKPAIMHPLTSPCLVVCSRATTREPVNEFEGAFAFSFVMSVRRAWNNSAPSGRICKKVYI
jgi:hypothetical protein